MIEKLVADRHAYVVEGVGVYFRVHSFPEYGELSGNNPRGTRGRGQDRGR